MRIDNELMNALMLRLMFITTKAPRGRIIGNLFNPPHKIGDSCLVPGPAVAKSRYGRFQTAISEGFFWVFGLLEKASNIAVLVELFWAEIYS